MKMLLLLLCAFLLAPGVQAQEEPTLTLHSTVSGSRELPRVMYIVPWQAPGAASADYQLQESLAAELFVPIDRDEFVRGLVFQTMLDANTRAVAVEHGTGITPAN